MQFVIKLPNQQSHREGGDACRDASATLSVVAVKMSQSLSFSLTAQTSCIVQVRVDPLIFYALS